MLTRERFYRWALWLPAALPAAVAVLSLFFPKPFRELATLLFTGTIYSLASYPVVAVLAFRHLRHRPLRNWERALLWLPLAHAPLCGLIVAAVWMVGDNMPLAEAVGTWRGVTLAALAFGYGYALLARIIAAFLPVTEAPAGLPANSGARAGT
jgi:hypothetical protein